MLFETADVLETKVVSDRTKIEVLSIKSLSGSSHISLPRDLLFAKEVDLTLKMIRITLNNSSIRLESGGFVLHAWRSRNRSFQWRWYS